MKIKSLKSTFYMLLIPSVFLISIVTSIFILDNKIEYLYKDMESKFNINIEVLSKILAYPIWNFNKEQAIEISSSFLKDADMVGVYIYDDANKLFSSMGIEEESLFYDEYGAEKRFPDSFEINNLFHILERGLVNNPDKEVMISLSKPVYFIGDGTSYEIGEVVIVVSDKQILDRIYSEIMTLFFFLLFIFLLIALIMSSIYQFTISKPFQAMILHMRNILKLSKIDIGSSSENEIVFISNQFEEILDKLNNEKEFLSVTLRSIGDGVITTDENGNITFINYIAEKIIEHNSDMVMGKSVEEIIRIFQDEIEQNDKNLITLAKDSNEVFEFFGNAYLHLNEDNSKKPIEGTMAPKKDSKGNKIGSVIILRDITEKNRLQEVIIKNQKLESLGLLAGGIAHDFNNYLSGIFGFIELALSSLNDESADITEKYLHNVMDVSEKAKSLTNQLLTFSKGGSSKKEVVDVKEGIKKSLRFFLSGSMISPIIKIDDDLWNCYCDKNQIFQCIDNIILNSIQSMNNEGCLSIEAVNVSESHQLELKNQSYIKIVIKDTGSGIPPHIISKIYDPFFTTKSTGHGLGLATVYSIIKNHDGSINVNSTVGKGTEFIILLPAQKETISIDMSEEESEVKCSGTILLLDDQDYILEMLTEMLSKFGYDIIATNKGEKALKEIENDLEDKKIGLCLLDLTLPGDLSGIEIAKIINNKYPDLPLIASSGYSDSPVLSNPKEYFFTDALSKPINARTLKKMISKYIS